MCGHGSKKWGIWEAPSREMNMSREKSELSKKKKKKKKRKKKKEKKKIVIWIITWTFSTHFTFIARTSIVVYINICRLNRHLGQVPS